jgi:hypothetical protein
MDPIKFFLYGALVMAMTIAALFFVRFYRQTSDRFFLWFAAAFGILALNRVLLVVWEVPDEVRPVFYAVRVLAFLIILAAIVDKNRPRRTN